MPVPAATLVLLGWVGGESWQIFAGSPEARDGVPNPLDRWSHRVIDDIAVALEATPLYSFSGPPWLPFQRWAQRADQVFVSPLGILIHPDWGLWHSYRGALAFAERLPLPIVAPGASPCASCVEKPCLTHCPVDAFAPGRYDVEACVGHISSAEGAACISGGCLARLACPVGAEHRYPAPQAAFHMQAFRDARRLRRSSDSRAGPGRPAG